MSNHEAYHLINEYIEELLKWNKKINLIGRNTEKDILEIHLNNSLALLPYLKSETVERVIDIGSGGGFPAIPLSILLPSKKFILTETNERKLAFLEWIASKLKLNIQPVGIDNTVRFPGECVIISRAFSSIENIIKWQKLHAPEALRLYLLKGKIERVNAEIESAGILKSAMVNVDSLSRGCIVTIRLSK